MPIAMRRALATQKARSSSKLPNRRAPLHRPRACFAFGLRIVETSFASIRIFFQIWDSAEGTIAWEGMQEMQYARDRISDKPVTLRVAAERTARDIIARLP